MIAPITAILRVPSNQDPVGLIAGCWRADRRGEACDVRDLLHLAGSFSPGTEEEETPDVPGQSGADVATEPIGSRMLFSESVTSTGGVAS